MRTGTRPSLACLVQARAPVLRDLSALPGSGLKPCFAESMNLITVSKGTSPARWSGNGNVPAASDGKTSMAGTPETESGDPEWSARGAMR